MNTSVNHDSAAAADPVEAFGQLARKRRSVYAYRDEDVPRELIERALADAVLAPNHHRTAPWRFFVITRPARQLLVDAYEAAAHRLGRDVARAVQRAKDAPVNVVLACVPDLANPRVLLQEEEFAVAAAAQNLMLSLTAAGVDTLLTTGELALSPELAQRVGLPDPPARLMGVLNVGYRNPARPLAARPDRPLAQVVSWIERN
ncbi:MAG: nitroreductase family protein [Burkholderiaceae bacterium]